MPSIPPLIIWRETDESVIPIIRVLHAAQYYKVKFGIEPNELHVPPQFPDDLRNQLSERFEVIVDVPKFFKNEMFIGVRDPERGRHLMQLEPRVG